jgi:hypothetical protein
LCFCTEGQVFRALIASAGAGELGISVAETAMVLVKVPAGGPQGEPSVEDRAVKVQHTPRGRRLSPQDTERMLLTVGRDSGSSRGSLSVLGSQGRRRPRCLRCPCGGGPLELDVVLLHGGANVEKGPLRGGRGVALDAPDD